MESQEKAEGALLVGQINCIISRWPPFQETHGRKTLHTKFVIGDPHF